MTKNPHSLLYKLKMPFFFSSEGTWSPELGYFSFQSWDHLDTVTYGNAEVRVSVCVFVCLENLNILYSHNSSFSYIFSKNNSVFGLARAAIHSTSVIIDTPVTGPWLGDTRWTTWRKKKEQQFHIDLFMWFLGIELHEGIYLTEDGQLWEK